MCDAPWPPRSRSPRSFWGRETGGQNLGWGVTGLRIQTRTWTWTSCGHVRNRSFGWTPMHSVTLTAVLGLGGVAGLPARAGCRSRLPLRDDHSCGSALLTSRIQIGRPPARLVLVFARIRGTKNRLHYKSRARVWQSPTSTLRSPPSLFSFARHKTHHRHRHDCLLKSCNPFPPCAVH